MDLSPEGINKTHGKAVWKCWGCKSETGLHWYNGWSVAMCRKQECAASYREFCFGITQEQEAFDAYTHEVYGAAPT